ncbi:MAG TPA: response regulator [Spirochaetia bacterium]|nr:response regulator [Spirochaetia bacterium]
MYRLLIADDEKLERDALRYIIQKGSLAVEEIRDASNGREAVTKAVQFRPEICFLDIKMPGLSGIAAARRIKQELPGVHIVFLTAFDYFDYAQEAIKIGVDDFIIKPASDGDVIKVIQRVTTALDLERTARAHNELVEQKLDYVAASIQVELSEGLARGFVHPEKLTEFAALREFAFEKILVATTSFDFTVYPMKIQGDAQKTILRKRSLRLLERILHDAGFLVVSAATSEGARLICFLPVGAHPLASFEAAAGRIRRELSIETATGLSGDLPDPTEIEEGLSQARSALAKAVSCARRVSRYEEAIIMASRVTRQSSDPAVGEAGTHFPPQEIETKLFASVLAGDRQASRAASADLFLWFSTRYEDLAELTDSVRDFFVVLHHQLTRRLPHIGIGEDSFAEQLRNAAQAQEVRVAAHNHLESLIDSARAAGETVPPTVLRARKYIDSHYAEQISLESVAAHVRQSTSHLSRLFKRHTGFNLVEYINIVRIARSKRMLETEDLGVREISLQVGYTDPSYFARVFRRREGVSPSDYRRLAVSRFT